MKDSMNMRPASAATPQRKKIRKMYEGMVDKRSPVGLAVDIGITIILCGIIFASLMPMWHTLMASLSDGRSLIAHEGLLWLPAGGFSFDGYKLVFTSAEYQVLRGYINTIVYVGASSLLGLILNVFGGYVLSCKSKLKPIFTLYIIFTMMFSGGTVPTYMVLKAIGLVGTELAPLSVIIPGCTNAIFMVLAMNSFLQVPEATIEAAKLDGAGHFRIMFQVVLPQGMSLVFVAFINTLIISWNSWFNAMIYLAGDKDWWPLQLWIKEITADSETFLQEQNPNFTKATLEHVVIIISVLPLFIAFPFFIKRLEKGMVIGGVKE